MRSAPWRSSTSLIATGDVPAFSRSAQARSTSPSAPRGGFTAGSVLPPRRGRPERSHPPALRGTAGWPRRRARPPPRSAATRAGVDSADRMHRHRHRRRRRGEHVEAQGPLLLARRREHRAQEHEVRALARGAAHGVDGMAGGADGQGRESPLHVRARAGRPRGAGLRAAPAASATSGRPFTRSACRAGPARRARPTTSRQQGAVGEGPSRAPGPSPLRRARRRRRARPGQRSTRARPAAVASPWSDEATGARRLSGRGHARSGADRPRARRGRCSRGRGR